MKVFYVCYKSSVFTHFVFLTLYFCARSLDFFAFSTYWVKYAEGPLKSSDFLNLLLFINYVLYFEKNVLKFDLNYDWK